MIHPYDQGFLAWVDYFPLSDNPYDEQREPYNYYEWQRGWKDADFADEMG